jgi:mono/diheme cytochrome c family protein
MFTTPIAGVLAMVLAGTVTKSAPPDDSLVAESAFTTTVKPFVAKHCVMCHGATTAKAGYRIDLLGTDFSAPNVAEQWKEVSDRINAGEMPPQGQPRPNVEQTVTLVTWVNQRLREVELAAQNAGGRIPMRRLNRDEYANTVRDLLKLDELIVRPLTEELPADGLAEGFDRLGVALFFDQTQIERSLAVASKLAARAIVTEPPRVNRLDYGFEIQRLRPRPDRMIRSFIPNTSNSFREAPHIAATMTAGEWSRTSRSRRSSRRTASIGFASEPKSTTEREPSPIGSSCATP